MRTPLLLTTAFAFLTASGCGQPTDPAPFFGGSDGGAPTACMMPCVGHEQAIEVRDGGDAADGGSDGR